MSRVGTLVEHLQPVHCQHPVKLDEVYLGNCVQQTETTHSILFDNVRSAALNKLPIDRSATYQDRSGQLPASQPRSRNPR